MHNEFKLVLVDGTPNLSITRTWIMVFKTVLCKPSTTQTHTFLVQFRTNPRPFSPIPHNYSFSIKN